MKQVLLFLTLASLLSCGEAGRVDDTKDLLFEEYFPLRSNDKKFFYVSHITGTDTLTDENDSSFCMSNIVKNKEIFYFTDEPGDSISIIGSQSFCNGVFYFKDGEFFVSPIFWQKDLKESNLAYFERLFPRKIVLDSIYKYQHGENKRKYIFDKPEDVSIKGNLLPACLKLTIIQDWPTERYVDTVWFQKNIGVVKWLRSTGRLEEIKL
jgi:hypothetical protein